MEKYGLLPQGWNNSSINHLKQAEKAEDWNVDSLGLLLYPRLWMFLFLQQCQEALITEKEFTSPEVKEAEEMRLSFVMREKD